MKVYIPTRDIVDDDIIDSINNQTLKVDVEIVPCDYDLSINKYQRVIMCRIECQKRALANDDEYVIFHDGDILNLYNDNFEVLYEFLRHRIGFGAAALRRDRSFGHIYDSVTMYKRKALEVVKFDMIHNICPCYSIKKTLKNNRLEYDFGSNKVRIKHLSSFYDGIE